MTPDLSTPAAVAEYLEQVKEAEARPPQDLTCVQMASNHHLAVVERLCVVTERLAEVEQIVERYGHEIADLKTQLANQGA